MAVYENNPKSIARWLWRTIAAPDEGDVEAYVKKLFPLFKKASFALEVLNATNTVAFVWDLANAPREQYYQITHTAGELERWVGGAKIPLYKALAAYGLSNPLVVDTRDLPPLGLSGYGLSNGLIVDTRNLPSVGLSGYGLSARVLLDTRRGWTGMAESPVFTIDLRD